ncbi:apolipoprotein D-like [Hyposmocoma kahamanoa]|uniref:apolipoprotein D-like n=1 Tax=Hyposmocoma kahamanoa TaxID=1477025 RepID=UPI000E6D901B|nr:apolipoprotein D-like [Hyposmocoma kahamanoa]
MSVIRAIAVFLCGFLSLRVCRAQVLFPGACPDVAAMADFNANRVRYWPSFIRKGKNLLTIIGNVNDFSTGIQSEIQGEANQVSRSDEGKLSVRFPSLPVNFAAPYWIVDTDYDNYALVWSCYDFGFFHTRNAWILTRERNPPLATLEKVYMAADKNNINRAYFMRTDQRNCPDNYNKV